MKHTPGPWHLQDNDGAYVMIRGAPEPQMNNGQSVAKVWLQDSDFNEANARLIAAAPDMLEALKIIIGNLKAHGNATPLLFGALLKAELAVKKAEDRK